MLSPFIKLNGDPILRNILEPIQIFPGPKFITQVGKRGGKVRFTPEEIIVASQTGSPGIQLLGNIASFLLPLIGSYLAKKGVDYITKKEKDKIEDMIDNIDVDDILEKINMNKMEKNGGRYNSLSNRSRGILNDIFVGSGIGIL